ASRDHDTVAITQFGEHGALQRTKERLALFSEDRGDALSCLHGDQVIQVKKCPAQPLRERASSRRLARARQADQKNALYALRIHVLDCSITDGEETPILRSLK